MQPHRKNCHKPAPHDIWLTLRTFPIGTVLTSSMKTTSFIGHSSSSFFSSSLLAEVSCLFRSKQSPSPSLLNLATVWHSGSALGSINEVILCQAGWVTSPGFNSRYLSQYITSHPGQLSLAISLWVGTMSTSQRAVMLCRLGSKGRHGLCVGGR